MNIQKLTFENKELVEECDKLLLKFLESEKKYDENYKEKEKNNSFLNDLLDENKILLVAIEKNNVLGFIYGLIENKTSLKLPVGHICFLYVDNEYRNKKIATSLIDAFLNELKKSNIEIVEVKSFENNEAAKALYIKYNFKPLWTNYRKI
jgi:ribosomal protein S18 acetylase RimI-like enzyme